MTQLDMHLSDRHLQAMRRPIQFVIVMTVAMASDLSALNFGHFRSPGLILLPAICVIGMLGGLRPALIAAAVTVLFVACVDSAQAPLFHAPWDHLGRLFVLCISAPTVAVVVGALHRRGELTAALQLESERAQAAQRARNFESEKATLLLRNQLSQQRANDLIGSVPGVVWETSIINGEIAITFISSHAQRLLGYPLAPWTSKSNFWLEIIHPEDREEACRLINAICKSEGASARIDSAPLEFRWMDQHGKAIWVETRLVPLSDENRCIGFRAVTLDINQRKLLEQTLRSRATELSDLSESLKRSNEELDKFAYVTSHDLKAPLRGISNLSHWIEEDMGDRFTTEAREQMALLRGRVTRMESLINGLLEYSHVGRTGGQIQPVDTALLLSEVIDWIGAPPSIQFEIQPGMPVLTTDRLRLQQVFSNLLGNAVKHHGLPDGRIIVKFEDHGEFLNFSVTDDGKGIDPRYHERIFDIFQTLLPRDQMEGTGIGLSLVKKVVETKGGTVSVSSTVGQGATFSFTWPKTEPGDLK